MSNNKIKTVVLSLIGFAVSTAHAQEAAVTADGNALGNGGLVNYTIGQIVYTTNSGVNGSALEGVQQAFEILIEAELKEVKGINLMVSAYPNPTNHFLNLKVENYGSINWMYKLFDMSGKLLETKIIEGAHTRIGLGNLESATYFVQVIQNKKEVKTFKIIKY